jgi:transposase
VSDGEWDFIQPYLCLLSEDVPQRKHDLRPVFNGLRYVARSGCAWRYLPHDLPPWEIVYHPSLTQMHLLTVNEAMA